MVVAARAEQGKIGMQRTALAVAAAVVVVLPAQERLAVLAVLEAHMGLAAAREVFATLAAAQQAVQALRALLS